MKVAKAALDPVLKAFDDFLSNRLPLPLHVRMHNARKVAADAHKEREEIRSSLVKSHAPEGKESITDQDPGWAEWLEKVNEVWREELELDFGPVVDMSKIDAEVAKKIILKDNTYPLLSEIGLLVEAA